MKNININGRSMIEMLGVLSIVGILGVGFTSVINYTRMVREENQLISETAQLAAITRKIGCQYDAGYGENYVQFLKSSELLSNFNVSENKIKGSMDSTTTITTDTDPEKRTYFVITVSDVDESRTCMKLATTDWGSRRTNGFLGVSVGTSVGTEAIAECMKSGTCTLSNHQAAVSGTIMPLAKAASYCKQGENVIKLWFKACH